MRASHLSYAFLFTFVVAIFALQWWPLASYPPSLWWSMLCLGFVGCVSSLWSRTRLAGLFLLALVLGISLSLVAVCRITRAGEPPALFAPTHPILLTLNASRERVERTIEALYPEPHAGLLIGLLTGSRATLPPEVLEAFRTTGLTHLIAISGYNVTLVVTLLSGFFFWLPLRWRFVPSCLGIVAFTLFTGASASVVRAAIMGMLSLFALQNGRLQTIRLTILWTLFAMLLWNPRYLWEDAGFQLSFLAIVGLTEITPLLTPFFQRLPDFLGVRAPLQTTIAVQIVTNPWICFVFGRLSLIAPLSNLLAPPLVPIAMLAGAASLCLYALWPPLGVIASLPAYLALSGILWLGQGLSALPLASLDLPLSQPLLLLTYALIFVWWMEQMPAATTDTSESAPSSDPRAP